MSSMMVWTSLYVIFTGRLSPRIVPRYQHTPIVLEYLVV
jgi:hypothetical protein